MQLMPDTASLMQVRDIDDPRDNIFGGVRLLRILANEFNGDLELTVAAYNAGDGAVIRFGGIPPFAQTRDYVVHVTKYYRRYRTIADVIEASLSERLSEAGAEANERPPTNCIALSCASCAGAAPLGRFRARF